ncbi:MAG: ribonuclease J, partial [Rhodospirillales bacterium]
MSGDPGLYFLPLGGSGEIGMNLNLYRYRGKWLMVDLGVTFGEGSGSGVDVIMPDPSFIAERREDLLGLVLTHAHEDHLGAVQYLWPLLRCPIYATGFTASFLKRKLLETDFARDVPIHVLEQGAKFRLGDFEIEYIHITHSIPEPNALAIRTPAGTILHTGDWKLDDMPMLGPVTDEAAFRRVGNEGVLALVGDSTNAIKDGTSGSEGSVAVELEKLIAQAPNRVAVACFASNVARVESVARAAKKAGRECALVGRSLWRIYEAARENGYMRDLPPFLTESDAGYVPRERIVMLCTGSQGEPRAALSRIAEDQHPHVVLEDGDWALFSS